jgi:catechol 2,3-dioxygenase-like lactoylglutathione lyase family enzyme
MFEPFPMMFHPTLLVDDLDRTTRWFERVFGRREVRWGEKWNLEWLNPSYPIDYSYFFVVGDVSIDALCPSLLTLADGSPAVYPEGQGLADIAWFVDDIEDVSRALERAGFRTRDQRGNVIRDGDIPESGLVADCPMIWTLPDDTGLTYEFYRMARRHWPKYSLRADPRLDPEWVPDVVVDGDPLGILHAAHHTVRTLDPDRARRMYVDVLGGSVVGSGRDEATEADYLDVAYARSVLRFLTPDSGSLTDARTGSATTSDQYTGITFDVTDVRATGDHLARAGVRTEDRAGELVTVAADALGVEWGFRETR